MRNLDPDHDRIDPGYLSRHSTPGADPAVLRQDNRKNICAHCGAWCKHEELVEIDGAFICLDDRHWYGEANDPHRP